MMEWWEIKKTMERKENEEKNGNQENIENDDAKWWCHEKNGNQQNIINDDAKTWCDENKKMKKWWKMMMQNHDVMKIRKWKNKQKRKQGKKRKKKWKLTR